MLLITIEFDSYSVKIYISMYCMQVLSTQYTNTIHIYIFTLKLSNSMVNSNITLYYRLVYTYHFLWVCIVLYCFVSARPYTPIIIQIRQLVAVVHRRQIKYFPYRQMHMECHFVGGLKKYIFASISWVLLRYKY